MKHFVPLAIAIAAFAAHAQAPDDAAERARIRGERQAAEARYTEAQKACRAKFAVNDCLDDARRAHNVEVNELKRQERVLNDAERKRKAAERQRDIDERNSPERQKEAAEKRAKAAAEQQEREAQAAEKAAKKSADDAERARRGPRVKEPHGSSGPQGKPRDPKAPASHAPTPDEAAKNRAAYEERLREAQRHKAEVAERNAKKGKSASADLPPPAR
ncbi:hypothetical protein H8N03_11930 [Ramlibacter sp. USB13]|uniref:Uncharacterized protein n=1 Tax=Ramlibacter cellulosilyticus TaxID=2764187 RepID=A0A923SF73_9BURK|nr:hypothetical protein [Ramlibacter cellulosilyticus]MBC5783657.1 hypothetical protein [Ramlibacter cellulosilyticus]